LDFGHQAYEIACLGFGV
jgi:hypothetical protein